MSILLGDIGGTRARFELRGEGKFVARRVYFSKDYKSLDSLLQTFFLDVGYFDNEQKPSVFVLAIAGPVVDKNKNQCVKVTNLSWVCSTDKICQQFKVKKVLFINDLKAAAYGLDYLKSSDFIKIHNGVSCSTSPKLLLGIGTGYGQSLFFKKNEEKVALASEAGHMNYAPFNTFSHIFYESLAQSSPNDYKQVSIESLLSGEGIVKLYDYLKDHSSINSSSEFSASMKKQKTPETISYFAHRHEALAESVLEYYVELLGGQAANASLNTLPMGGLYIMGGIAQHITPWLLSDYFINAFLDNTCMYTTLNKIPIYIVTSDNLGILGARHIANNYLA